MTKGMFKADAVCQSCAFPAESVASGGNRGSLILYEMTSGPPAYLHRVCAEPHLSPAQALPEMFQFPARLLEKVEDRHLRRRIWANRELAKIGGGA